MPYIRSIPGDMGNISRSGLFCCNFDATECSNGSSPDIISAPERFRSRNVPMPGSNVSGSVPDGNSVVMCRLSPPMALAKYSRGGMETATDGILSVAVSLFFWPLLHDAMHMDSMMTNATGMRIGAERLLK